MQATRVALVTGASRGIGRAIAERLGADGMSVVVNYRTDRGAAQEVVDRIAHSGGTAVAAQADVSDPDELYGLFDAAERNFGGLDAVVSNVGFARFAPVTDATDEDFDAMFATNTRAGFIVLREAARRVRDGGRIVAVSAGATADHSPGTGVYAASKAAVEQVVRVLAKELGPRRVTVNNVLPGPTRTDALIGALTDETVERMVAETPLGRLGEPEDIADVAGFLASDDSRWLTGQSLRADGGMY
ncbi:SDR family oxidoreductase [Streptomonospora sediminis]